MTFEELLIGAESALQRFVLFRVDHRQDAEDILQEVRLSAYRGFDTVKRSVYVQSVDHRYRTEQMRGLQPEQNG